LGVWLAAWSNACNISASPARIATSSPKTLWLVGTPRRIASLSMAGRSSCTSDAVCAISMATAAGIATSAEPPNASHAARHNIGRTRFPPAMSE